MNKNITKLLIGSTINLTVTMSLGLGLSLFPFSQVSIAQEEITNKDSALLEADNLTQQAIQLYQQGKYIEAIPLAKKALAIREKHLGEDNLNIAYSLNNLAELYKAKGDYEQAEPLYQQALAIKQKLLGNNHLDTAISLSNLAALYDEQGKYSQAQPLYQQALSIKQKLLGKNHISTAISLNNLGFIYEAQGKNKQAESSYQEALNIARQQLGENHPDTATFYANLARISNAQGKYDAAENYHSAAFKIRQEQLGEKHPLTAESINDLGYTYQAQERYQKAESFYLKALAINQEIFQENHQSISDSLNNLATLYHVIGKYNKAERFYLDTLAITKKLGINRWDTAQTLNNLAELYQVQGRYTEAEPLYLEALEIKEQKEDLLDTAVTHNNLAALYRLQGRFDESEEFYEKALENTVQKLGKKHPASLSAFNNLAVLYETQGFYEEAETIYAKVLDFKREVGKQDNLSIAISLNNLAGIYRIQDRYAEAQPLYQEALEIRKKILGTNHPNISHSLNNLAANYNSQGQYQEAEKLYQQALEIRQEILGKYHPDTATSFYNLAILYQSQGNTGQAVKFLTNGLVIEEKNLSDNLIAGSEQQKLDYIATISNTTNAIISLNLQSVSHKSEQTKLALTTILQRKGRILDVLTNSLQVLRQRTNDPETKKLLADYYNLRNEYSNLVFSESKEIETPDIHHDKLSDLDKKTKQLEDKLSRRSAEFRNFSEAINLEKIQNLIPQNAALVELVRYQPFNPQAAVQDRWGESRYAAYILSHQGEPQAIDLGEAKPIDQAVDQFRRNLCTNSPGKQSTNFCLQGNFARFKKSSRQLEQLVMQPVRELLGNTKNVLLSPDSKLNLLPFEALVDENNQYLLENYNFTYLTSGRDLIRLQHKSPSKELPLVLADPLYNQEFSTSASVSDKELPLANVDNNPENNLGKTSQLFSPDSFPRLEATEKEALKIQSILNLSTKQIKLQSQANENLLKQVQSPHFLHIATHGFFLDKSFKTYSNLASSQINDNPLLRSGLALAGITSRRNEVKLDNDGIFTAYEATLLNLVGTRLVVLSACDTGVGDISTGEGIYGLRRALVMAGSESQLISLWKVADEGTKDLMTAYYQLLKQGDGRTNALHEVQKQMLRGELKGEEGQSYQHPYYWASFIPSGDWTPIEF